MSPQELTIAAVLFKPGLRATRPEWHFTAARGHHSARIEALITAMLVKLTRSWRRRAATFVVALYALSLLAPTAAFAFSDSAAAAHCLTLSDDHHGASQSHHHDGHDHAAMAHEDTDHGIPASGGGDHALPGKCCGLFCVTALTPPVFGVADAQLMTASQVAMPAATSLLGRSSNRIDRPPRLLPFV